METNRRNRVDEEYEDDMPLPFAKRNVTRRGGDIYFFDEVDEETHVIFLQLFEDAKQWILQNTAHKIAEAGGLTDYVKIHINSPGGLVTSSLAIYDFLKNEEMPSVGIVTGMAASGASLILLGCTKRIMLEHSYVLIHELRSGTAGKYSEIMDDVENWKYMMEQLKTVYLEETEVPAEDIDATLSHDRYWGAEECKKYKIVDSYIGEPNIPSAKEINEGIKEHKKAIVILEKSLGFINKIEGTEEKKPKDNKKKAASKRKTPAKKVEKSSDTNQTASTEPEKTDTPEKD